MADNHEPMSDKWLETLAREIAIPLQAHAAGPVAQIAQRNAWASLNYLVQRYKDLRAALEQEQREHANCEHVNVQRFQTLTDTIIDLTQQVTAMHPMVEAVAKEIEPRWYNKAGVWGCEMCTEEAYSRKLFVHSGVCPVTQARAYLAKHPAGGAS